MYKRLFLLLIYANLYGKLPAQITVQYNGNEVVYNNTNIKLALLPITTFTDSTLLAQNSANWNKLQHPKPKISYSPNTTWVTIPITDITQYGPFEYLNINSPHINFLKCWIVKNDSIIISFNLTGDNTVFSTRPLTSTSFVFPINSTTYKYCNIVIAADKRYTKLELPIVFSNSDYYFSEVNKHGLFYGLLVGFCALLFLFNLYLLVTVRQAAYSWYCLYLLLILVYFLTGSGLFFKYVMPHLPVLNDVLRPIVLCFLELPLFAFFIGLLQVHKLYPKVFKASVVVMLLYTLTFLIIVLQLKDGDFEFHGKILSLSSLLVPLYLTFAFGVAVYLVVNKVPFAWFAFWSLLIFDIFFFLYGQQQKENIPTNFITQYANYWAIITEAIIATLLIVWQYRFYKQESTLLLEKNMVLQKEVFEETVAWQENELKRLSGILHDTVGANLGYLRMETDNMPLTEKGKKDIATKITQLGNEVRSLSHSFSPFVLKTKGLKAAIDDTINTININGNTKVQMEWIGNIALVPQQHEVSIFQIVQELLQNMLKHANAKVVLMQLLAEPNLLFLYYEDDGIGFDAEHEKSGIGLQNIKNLVQLMKGICQIESAIAQGCTISIEIKTNINE